MKLLILTQKIDKNDPILGFFHRWTKEFARQCEKITVICLEKGLPREISQSDTFSDKKKDFTWGEYDLPENVSVYSLGKEKARTEGGLTSRSPQGGERSDLGEYAQKIKYIVRFYTFIWRERKEYDSVFVHMNPIYINLAWLFWKAEGKRVSLWYNHTSGGLGAYAAARVADHVFHTSPFAYTAQFKNATRMPAGIDTEQFNIQKGSERTQNSILFIGRIAPIKGVHVLVEAVNILAERGVDFTLDVYGDALPEHTDYLKRTKNRADALAQKGIVAFHNGVPNEQTPAIYNTHELFVNLTPAGNYDKTVLEAMACGCNVVASSEAFADILPSTHQFAENNATDLADALQKVIGLSEKEKETYTRTFQEYVTKNHSLDTLSEQVFTALKNEK